MKHQSKTDEWRIKGAEIEEIIQVGDPMLRQVAPEYQEIAKLAPIADKLVGLLRSLKGAGMAASQIGSSASLIVVEVRKTDLFPDRPESPLYIMINPVVTESSHEREKGWEGCYSIPGVMAQVERPVAITVKYDALDGEKHEERFTGYVARVVQHEIDHLRGILFTDRMDPVTLTTVTNWKKYHYHRDMID